MGLVFILINCILLRVQLANVWSSKQARLTYMMSGNFSKYSEGLVIRTISRCIFLLMVAAVLLNAWNEIEIKSSHLVKAFHGLLALTNHSTIRLVLLRGPWSFAHSNIKCNTDPTKILNLGNVRFASNSQRNSAFRKQSKKAIFTMKYNKIVVVLLVFCQMIKYNNPKQH